ncbi:MAG: metal-dependent transcriptional regulator [Phycisphaerae bacterium]
METWKEFEHNEITHSAAHHLMAIDDLVSKLGYARVSDVARELHITRGSVSISLRPLKEAGLVLQDENRHIRLSEQGDSLVKAIKGKRGLMKRLLNEVLGVNEEQAEIDACKTEHLVSNDVARRIISLLKFVDSNPEATRHFFSAWRNADPDCGHEPRSCRMCVNDCLQDHISLGR